MELVEHVKVFFAEPSVPNCHFRTRKADMRLRSKQIVGSNLVRRTISSAVCGPFSPGHKLVIFRCIELQCLRAGFNRSKMSTLAVLRNRTARRA